MSPERWGLESTALACCQALHLALFSIPFTTQTVDVTGEADISSQFIFRREAECTAVGWTRERRLGL